MADGLITDAQVDAILDELNAGDAGLQDLDRWAAQSPIQPDRVIVGPDITYVRLAGRAEHGGAVVLLHFEHSWERATQGPPAPRLHDLARRRIQREGTPVAHIRERRRAADRP
jgi:hypothetical protein